MKWLLVLLVLALAVLMWRSGRRQPPQRVAKPDAPDPATQDMVLCPVCAVHVPRADAFAGRRGEYCSAEHRKQAEH